MSQIDKKRKIRIDGNIITVQSRKIKIGDLYPEMEFAKAKINNVWYIFEASSGYVIYQGNKWMDALNASKDFLTQTDGKFNLLTELFKL